jgi:two-component system chemotaxis response regulator CheB
MLDDGTAGLWALKRSGGISVIQDLNDAVYPDMPRNASEQVRIDHTAPARKMGALLASLVAEPESAVKPSRKATTLIQVENGYAKLEDLPHSTLESLGQPTSLVCPGCHGPLWLLKNGPRPFRCHTGHAYTPSSLIEEHRELAEKTLAVLVTLFEDEVILSQHILETSTHPEHVQQMRRDLTESKERAATLRKLLPGGFKQKHVS